MKITKKKIHIDIMNQLQNIKNQMNKICEICDEIDRLNEKYLNFPKRRLNNHNYPFFSDKLTGWLFCEETV